MAQDANRAAAGGRALRCAAGVLLALAAAGLVRAAGQPQDPLAAALEAGDADAAFALTPAIVEPGHRGWPRTVVGVNGRVTIRRPPQRLVTLSVGHDEIAFALLPPARIAAVGWPAQQPFQSNVAALARDHPAVGREPERIAAARPDLVILPGETGPDVAASIARIGAPILQIDQPNTMRGRLEDILLLGYVVGEEARAAALASDVAARRRRLDALVQAAAAGARTPRAASLTSYGGGIFTAGRGSTEGFIIETAGAVNAAAAAGLSGNPTIGREGLVALAPDLIVIPQPRAGAERFRDALLADPALAGVPAVRRRAVHPVAPNFFTTLSFWNLRGAEELAALLWPERLGRIAWRPFRYPSWEGEPRR